MAELFETGVGTVNHHLKDEGELPPPRQLFDV